MKTSLCCFVGASALVLSAGLALGEIKIVAERNDTDHASSAFKFKSLPAPSKTDAAGMAKFVLIDGERDENGGELAVLHDGKAPTEEDQPAENFFFAQNTDGGRLLVDLGSPMEVSQVNTYSWHPNTRGPQVYRLYASGGSGDGFSTQPKKGLEEQSGWKLLAKVDTRAKNGENGGQYGVGISDTDGALGKYRYLLFNIMRTEEDDAFGNTFYSEIDVVAKSEGGGATADSPAAKPFEVKSPDGYCTISIDTARAPDLKDWAEQKLAPVLAEWYPKIVAMLPSEGYEAPKAFTIRIRPGDGVAATGGTNVTANSTWLKKSNGRMDPEAIGALLHEEVHVVQQYGWGRRSSTNAPRVRIPGYLTEGIPDYIRWFKFEPQSHGADAVWMSKRRNLKLSYDGMYRISANFLDYVVEHYDKGLIAKLNAACRQHTYTDEIWKTSTGKTVLELNDEWKAATEKQIAAAGSAAGDAESAPNSLSAAEKAAGWKLLFNGKDLAGWHNFKSQGIKAGWQVKDDALVCVDPHNAGDIVTEDQYGWFELVLDYNISEGGNSGIMYHVTDEGRSAWATGPEFQLEDNAKAADPIRCGWLYQLYQPPTDPATEKTLDATKPAGQWNHVRLLLSPEKCEHDINGVKYFEYVLGSDDFNARVAKSKFARMPNFAKAKTGYIALQGDHGQVSFRNIKVRPLPDK